MKGRTAKRKRLGSRENSFVKKASLMAWRRTMMPDLITSKRFDRRYVHIIHTFTRQSNPSHGDRIEKAKKASLGRAASACSREDEAT